MEPSKPALKIVRISSLKQLEELVGFICDAFMEDDLFCAMVPGHHEHPEAARSMWRMTLVEEYGRKGSVILAAHRQGENGEEGEFVPVQFGVVMERVISLGVGREITGINVSQH